MPTPAGAIPPGYANEDRGQDLINVAIIFIVLETVVVIAFFATRIKLQTVKGFDALLILPAYLVCVSLAVICFFLVNDAGVGRHFAVASPSQLLVLRKIEIIVKFLYICALKLPKLSILFFYLRIFDANKGIRVATYSTMVVVFFAWLGSFISFFLICTPFAFNWDYTIPGGHCGDIMAAYRFSSIPNLVTDVAILAIPIPGIWNLRMSMARKVGLGISFLMGSLGLVSATLRFVAFFQFDIYSDPTWFSVDVMTWTVVEPGVYLIAACLPSLVPIIRIVAQTTGLRSLLYRNTSEMTSREPLGEMPSPRINRLKRLTLGNMGNGQLGFETEEDRSPQDGLRGRDDSGYAEDETFYWSTTESREDR